MNEPQECLCCDKKGGPFPPVGYCRECTDAINRFVTIRRYNMVGEGKEHHDRWVETQSVRQTTGGRV